MSEEIKNVKLKFACSENWEAMPNAEGGKHCDKCQKKVYDFTNSKADEFRKVLAENKGNICGHFNQQQVVQQPVVLPFWKKWLSAATVLIGLNFVACKQPAEKVYVTTGLILVPLDSAQKATKEDSTVILSPTIKR